MGGVCFLMQQDSNPSNAALRWSAAKLRLDEVCSMLSSSPVVSTIHEKSEPVPHRERVRIFCLYQGHCIPGLHPPILWRIGSGDFICSTFHSRSDTMAVERSPRHTGVCPSLLRRQGQHCLHQLLLYLPLPPIHDTFLSNLYRIFR